MKNKIVIKNRKFRFVFKNVEDEKFKKVYKFLIGDKKQKKKIKKPKEEPEVIPEPEEETEEAEEYEYEEEED